MNSWMRVLCVAMLLVLVGCVSAPVSRPFNREAHADIRQVEVLPMRYSEIELMILNNPGYSFGLIGAAIAESHRIPKRNWLRENLQSARYDHTEAFRAALVKALEGRGYSVAWAEPFMEEKSSRTPRNQNGQRKQPGAVAADAQLDVNLGFVGYAAAGAGADAPYRPTAVASARLLSRDGKNVLFEETLLYNAVFNLGGFPVVIEPDPAYSYPDFDDMEAAPDQVTEGVRNAIKALAAEIAKHL